MATTTTNYGFDIPQSTDLVKDGATAIATLGQDIDTAMNTALGTKKAMGVLLSTVSFSGVASTSLAANTFTSSYTNYQLVMNFTNFTITGDVRIRLRASGSDNTSAIYGNSTFYSNSGGSSGLATADSTNDTWLPGYGSSTNLFTRLILDIFNPFDAIKTSAISKMVRSENTANGNLEQRNGGHFHGGATSFDSLTIYPTSGNFTGTYSVYGYNK